MDVTDVARVRRLDYETSKRLRNAIVQGDVETLKHFSSDVRTFLVLDGLPQGESLLGRAADEGKGAVVDALLRLGCDPNEPIWRTSGLYHLRYGLYAETPLTQAVGGCRGIFPDIENVRILLARGALVDGHPSGLSSPLSWAAITGNLPAAQLLVEAGADLYWEGWRDGPPLDEAIQAPVPSRGADKVAEYLRSLGATETYLEWHHWKDRELECIERTLGVVNPRPIERVLRGTSIAVYKARFAPRKFEHRLLFTHGLAPTLKAELGIVVSNLWPLNKGGLAERRFSWPIDLLFHLSGAVLGGAKLEHGSVLRAADEILRGFESPVPEWVVATSGRIEEARALGSWTGTVPVLLVTPVLTKKRYKPGKEALAEADKRSGFKWERVHLPLPDLTPVGYEYLKKLDETNEGAGS
jgi:hypothetical protein